MGRALRRVAVDTIDGGSLNDHDYAGQDPINGYDLDGKRWCWKACNAVDAGLQVTALAVYTPYYAAYQTNRYAGRLLPVQVSSALVVTQAAGLAGDAAVDYAKRKAGTSPHESVWDENPPGAKGSINPFGETPKTHLPGLWKDPKTKKKHVDIAMPWSCKLCGR